MDSAGLSESMENYLETIYLLMQTSHAARSKDIADKLQVKRSSVTGALQALRERGFVYYERYGQITLTPQGREIASKIRRRHEALRDFFIQVLAVDATEADAAACRMEHGISKPIVDRLIDFAQLMQTCPRAISKWFADANPPNHPDETQQEACRQCIRDCQEKHQDQPPVETETTMGMTLSQLKPGEKGRIEKLNGQGAVKRRIRDMGVTPGSLIEVVRVAPLGDPIDVKVRGYHLSLRKEDAADIVIQKV